MSENVPTPPEPEPIDADSLELGLGVAFGRAARLPGESVGAAIERRTGAVARILLRDDSEAPSPVLRILPAGSAERIGDDGRYQVLGEIARGGLGVVFKGRDRDLGRDVALKVLRPEHAKNDAVLARFVEEAQIGGQLQHPGIVPVYSIGIESDGRPFFAMKLVKGRTLASLLAERKSPQDGQHRLLAVLEQVCRTMAYAHSRRVVHRDLKPSNVMLGAFGEVQIVDWGLSKVLGRESGAPERPAAAVPRDISLIATVRTGSEGSASQAGSIMGTPGYMSPEQALGREIDERTDVFALGAILCAILTGDAPFTGDERDQIVAAAQGRLDEAFARLAACGADSELIDIATKSLAPVPAERFADAGAVADAMTAYLSGVEARTRKAEIAAANATIRAEEERVAAVRERAKATAQRSAHRRTVALAAIVVGGVVAGASWWLHVDGRESDRLARTAVSVSKAMEDANDRLGARDFAGAVAAAKKATALAQAGEADAATSTRAARLLAVVETEARAAAAAAEREVADSAFLAKLEDIRERRADVLEAQGTDAEFAAAFRDAGFDVEESSPESVAERIRAHGEAFAVSAASALDEWTWLRQSKEELAGRDRDRPGQVARLADPDAWRNRVRDAAAKKDVASLRELAASADPAALSAATLDLVGKILDEAREYEAAVEVLSKAQSLWPGDFWISLHLAHALVRLAVPRPDEAVALFTAAVALRPRSPLAWSNLGFAKSDVRDVAGATAAFQESIRLAPGSSKAHVYLADHLRKQKDAAGAVAAASEAVRLDPESISARRALTQALIAGGKTKEARSEAQEIARRSPGESGTFELLGSLCWTLRDATGAVAAYGESLRLDPGNAVAHANLGTVLLKGQRRFDEAIAHFREALRLSRDDAGRAAMRTNLAVALRDKGDLAESAVEAREAIRLQPALAAAHANLGRALADQGDVDGACAEFTLAIGLDPGVAEDHSDLGVQLLRKGDPRAALPHIRKAIELNPALVPPRNNLGVALNAAGDVPGATAAYRDLLRLRGGDADAWIGYGRSLLTLKDYEGAVEAQRQAVRMDARSAEGWTWLARSLCTASDMAEALAAAERALRLRPDEPHALAVRGVALCNRGRASEGVAELGRARDLASQRKDAEMVDFARGNLSVAQRFVALDARLADVLRGESAGLGHFDMVWCVDAACARGLPAEAARFAQKAFAEDAKLPDDPFNHALTSAARAAAMASAGVGDAAALSAADRTTLRVQALAWLRADLSVQIARIGSAKKTAVRVGSSRLGEWIADAAFASVRDASALAGLAALERESWTQFWSDVEAALEQARETVR